MFQPPWPFPPPFSVLRCDGSACSSRVPLGTTTPFRTTGIRWESLCRVTWDVTSPNFPRSTGSLSAPSGIRIGGLVLTCQILGSSSRARAVWKTPVLSACPAPTPPSSNHSPTDSLLPPHSSLLNPVHTLHGLGETHSTPNSMGGQGVALQTLPPDQTKGVISSGRKAPA